MSVKPRFIHGRTVTNGMSVKPRFIHGRNVTNGMSVKPRFIRFLPWRENCNKLNVSKT